MYEIGRICLKIAGRDANKFCVIIQKINDNFVMVDGQTRRKKVNLKHLEPTDAKLDIKENADHSVIVEAFSKYDIKIALKKSKKATERPKKIKVKKEKPVKEKKTKKVEKKVEEKKPEVKETELEKTLEKEVPEVKPKEEKKE